MGDVNRRDFLKRLLGRGASAFAESVAGDVPLPGKGDDAPGPARAKIAKVTIAREGASLDGIPVVHPWIAVARAVAETHRRRLPYPLLLGASGEAFRIAYDADDPLAGSRSGPVNTFLGALVIPGLTARASDGGEFEPTLGGAEVALGNGLSVVLGTDRGPAVLLGVNHPRGEVSWATSWTGEESVSFEELDRTWAEAVWPGGRAPYLRVAVEPLESPRPLDEIARAGFETMLMLLTREFRGPAKTGLAAYDAWAADLRAGRIDRATAEALHGDPLRAIGVGRAAAGSFLEAVARAIPPDHREPVKEAARCYARVHRASETGEFWGTGLFPELVECLTKDGTPDRDRLADEAVRERAADLLDEIRTQEAAAVEHIRSLPREMRTAAG